MYTFTAKGEITSRYQITNSSLGPFDNDTKAIKEEMFNVQKMSLNFQVHQYINPYASPEGSCYQEDLTQIFDFAKRGVVTVTLTAYRTTCDTADYWETDHPDVPPPPPGNVFHRLDDINFWLYVMVILLAIT